MSVNDDAQAMRDFIDALRLTLGLTPLYKQLPPSPPMVETSWTTFVVQKQKRASAG